MIDLEVTVANTLASSIEATSHFVAERSDEGEMTEPFARAFTAKGPVRTSPVVIKLPVLNGFANIWIPRVVLCPEFLEVREL